MPQPVLEAALKPSAAAYYLHLPVRMWTRAHRLVALVVKYRGINADVVDRIDQVLSDQDFMFPRGRRRRSQ